MSAKRKSSKKVSRFNVSSKAINVVGALLVIVAVAGVGTKYLSTSNADSFCVNYTYGIGSNGNCVNRLQGVLNNWNSRSGNDKKALALDGSYGPLTSTMVKNFQNWSNTIANYQTGETFRYLTVDGVVGHNTWQGLCYWAQFMSYSYGDVGCHAVYPQYPNG